MLGQRRHLGSTPLSRHPCGPGSAPSRLAGRRYRGRQVGIHLLLQVTREGKPKAARSFHQPGRVRINLSTRRSFSMRTPGRGQQGFATAWPVPRAKGEGRLLARSPPRRPLDPGCEAANNLPLQAAGQHPRLAEPRCFLALPESRGRQGRLQIHLTHRLALPARADGSTPTRARRPARVAQASLGSPACRPRKTEGSAREGLQAMEGGLRPPQPRLEAGSLSGRSIHKRMTRSAPARGERSKLRRTAVRVQASAVLASAAAASAAASWASSLERPPGFLGRGFDHGFTSGSLLALPTFHRGRMASLDQATFLPTRSARVVGWAPWLRRTRIASVFKPGLLVRGVVRSPSSSSGTGHPAGRCVLVTTKRKALHAFCRTASGGKL